VVTGHTQVRAVLSDEHFSVDGTLIEAWASIKSFRPKDGDEEPLGEGTPRATSTGSGGRTRRMPRPPIPTPGSIAKERARKPDWCTWVIC
jgi:hypothetical protein